VQEVAEGFADHYSDSPAALGGGGDRVACDIE
jgi:Cu/Zn superoxide dismutase